MSRRRNTPAMKAVATSSSATSARAAPTCRSTPPGDNCFILEDNTIQPFVSIGNNVTLWSGNHIGHDSTIDDHCFIASHVVVSGHVRVGTRSASSASTRRCATRSRSRPRRSIGAGAVIMKNTRSQRGLPRRSAPKLFPKIERRDRSVSANGGRLAQAWCSARRRSGAVGGDARRAARRRAADRRSLAPLSQPRDGDGRAHIGRADADARSDADTAAPLEPRSGARPRPARRIRRQRRDDLVPGRARGTGISSTTPAGPRRDRAVLLCCRPRDQRRRRATFRRACAPRRSSTEATSIRT